MDGTLTPARKQMSPEMAEKVLHLSKFIDIGIVSGSGIELIKQQIPETVLEKINIFPCNGTQRWVLLEGKLHQIGESSSMKEKIGQPVWNSLMRNLHNLQGNFMMQYNLPYTSDFISDRKTMVNWCPIGRNAGDIERQAWIQHDQEGKARNWLMNKLMLDMNGRGYLLQKNHILKFKLGGQTSIDIYPVGWDKTYVLNHLQDYDVWFVGDKCEKDGNDYEIFEYANEKNQGYYVQSSNETITIIDDILSRLRR